VVSLETANFCRLAWALLHKAIADQAQAKLKVDRAALLQRHGISAGEFAKITSSMTDLCFDILVRNLPMCVSMYVFPALYCVYQIERRPSFTSRV
jgi:hypothetical protein